MKPDKLSVQDLFEAAKHYVVPLYQRRYVWKQDSQWAPLWQDIEDKAEELWEKRDTIGNSGVSVPPHFLGTVVLSPVPVGSIREVPKMLIVDGQQRLTTMQVFLAALRDHARAAAEAAPEALRDDITELAEACDKLTRNQGRKRSPEEEHKVWPTRFDREPYEKVMTAGSSAQVNKLFPITRLKYKRKPEPRHLLVEAYQFFHDAIARFVAARPATPKHHPLESLHGALRYALQLVVIVLEEDDDPQIIFETLNARGTRLLATDLIRNHIFSRILTQEGSDALDALYRDFWSHYDERGGDEEKGFWHEEVKQGRLYHARLDLFFRHYIASLSGEDVSAGHLFSAFLQWSKKQEKDKAVLPVQQELDRLKRYSEVFRSFYEPKRIPEQEGRLRSFLMRARVLDTSTYYPLLLWLLVEAKESIPKASRDQMLQDLGSYLVRRWICGSSTKAYNKIFLGILKDLRSSGLPPGDTLRDRLKRLSGEFAWPNDAEFKEAWLHEPAYERLRSDGVVMVLRAIHEDMMTSKQEGVIITGKLTVEHLLPQDWKDHWPLPVADPGTLPDAPTPAQRRDELLHTFGNLTLLTQPLNSSVSNGPFNEKREAILAQGLLRLHHYFQNVTSWDEDAILQRGLTLFEAARRIWPHPSP